MAYLKQGKKLVNTGENMELMEKYIKQRMEHSVLMITETV